MTKKSKVIALFLAVIVLFSLMLSFSFIICESNHECIATDCQVCTIISTVNESLKNISFSVLALALTFALTYLIYKYILYSVDALFKSTPVVLKVKLLN